MKLALIPPIPELYFVHKTNYQLMLPHLLSDEAYARVYDYLCKSSDDYVIMDNGAAESQQFTAEQLLIVAETYQPNELVIPDVLGNASLTYNLIRDFMENRLPSSTYEGKLAVVAQGSSAAEALFLLDTVMEKWPEIDAVHIPRLLVKENDKAARLALAGAIHNQWPDKEIHLLGASSIWPEELRHAAQVEGIRGMDTSMPFNYAHQLKNVYDNVAIDRSEKYFDLQLDDAAYVVADSNVKIMKEWASGA